MFIKKNHELHDKRNNKVLTLENYIDNVLNFLIFYNFIFFLFLLVFTHNINTQITGAQLYHMSLTIDV